MDIEYRQANNDDIQSSLPTSRYSSAKRRLFIICLIFIIGTPVLIYLRQKPTPLFHESTVHNFRKKSMDYKTNGIPKDISMDYKKVRFVRKAFLIADPSKKSHLQKDPTLLSENLTAHTQKEETHPVSMTNSILKLSAEFAEHLPKNKNYLTSPYSLAIALSMLYEGTCKISECNGLSQIFEKQLGFNSNKVERYHDVSSLMKDTVVVLSVPKTEKSQNKSNPFQLQLANSLWVSEGFSIKRSFIDVIKNIYESEVKELDFANNSNSYKNINDWIANKTNDMIKDMLNELPKDTMLVLVNVIYFKADWLHKFTKTSTKKQVFNTVNSDSQNETKQVDMMHLRNARLSYYEDNDLNLFVELPYESYDKNSEVSMVIMVPNTNKNS